MMPGNLSVKSTAKAFLKPLWSQAIAAGAVLCACFVAELCVRELFAYTVSTAVGFVAGAVFFIFITAPLIMGYILWLWRVTVLEDSPFTEMFLPFAERDSYTRTLSFVLAAVIRAVAVFAVVMLPYAIASVASNPRFYEIIGMTMPVWMLNIWIFKRFLLVLGTAVFVYVMLRNYLAPVIFAVGSNLTPSEAFYMAKEVGADSFIAFVKLIFGFLGWLLCSVFIIPALYVLPYFSFSCIFHCRFAITRYNAGIKTKTYSYNPLGGYF